MRCGCPVCGSYAVQVQRGTDCLCKCPECGWECRDCMANGEEHFAFIDRDKAAWMKRLARELNDEEPKEHETNGESREKRNG